MPFLVITVEAGFRAMDRRYEDAAARSARRGARVPPRDAAAHRAVARRRRRAVLGPRARRVRRHDHVRRQLPGPHADAAARGLPRPRVRPEAAFALSLVLLAVVDRRARRAARPVVRSRREPRREHLASASAASRSTWRSTSTTARRSRCSARTARARSTLAARAGGPGPARARSRRARRHVARRSRCRRVRRARAPTGRRRVPGRPAVPASVGARERRLRVRAAGAARRRPRPRSGWLERMDLARSRRRAPATLSGRRSAAGRAGPGARRRAARCCCSTSRSPRSTRTRRSRARDAAPPPGPFAGPACWSRTIPTTRVCSARGRCGWSRAPAARSSR